MPMIDDLYSREILKRTTQIKHVGHLHAPQASADKTAKLCGSTIHVELSLTQDRVSDFAHVVKACALGQAAAAILSQAIIGASRDEIADAKQAMKAMLTGQDFAFPHRFSDFIILQSVKDFPARHASTLLALEATDEAIRKIA